MGARGPVAQPKPDHANAGYASGLPVMPKGLSVKGKEVWKFVCEQIPPDRSSPADKFALLGLVKWFERWSELMDLCEANPADFRVQRQATAAWNCVDQQLRQFGMTLVSRARMPAGKREEKAKADTGIAKILQMRQRKPG
jgi:hypothetical protein